MSIECCEVCGFDLTVKGKCPKVKYHPKFKKIQSLVKDGVSAFSDLESFKQSAYDSLDSANSVEEEVTAYKKLGYAFYVRFIKMNPDSSLTYETYMGLLLSSNSLYEIDKHQDAFDSIVNEYGKIFGMERGKTYVFEDGITRYIENSMFRAYAYTSGWVITNKETGIEDVIPYKLLRKTATDDFVFGYAKCLFYGNQE